MCATRKTPNQLPGRTARTRPITPFQSSFPEARVKPQGRCKEGAFCRQQRLGYHCADVRCWSAVAALCTTKIDAPATGAVHSLRRDSAEAPAHTKKNNAAPGTAGLTRTTTCSRNRRRKSSPLVRLVAVGSYGLLVVLQILFKTRTIINKLLDLRFQRAFTF